MDNRIGWSPGAATVPDVLKMPTDADGFVLPQVDPEAAWDAAAGLTSVASTVREALDVLEAAPVSALCWTGEAADGYRVARERLAARAVELAEVTATAASAVLAWMRDAAPAVAELRRLAVEGERLSARIDAAATVAYDPVLDAALNRELDDLLVRWRRGWQTYWDAVETTARRLLALRDGITDRPLDLHDQVEGAGRTAWEGAVAGPATTIWSLTGQTFTDRDAWWADVSAIPGGTADAVTALIEDPLGAAGTLLHVDDWSDGRYGEAAVGGAMAFLPGPRWLTTGRDLGAVRFAGNLADPAAPKPTVQTVDEMLAGVDLDRHEHYELGHALRRHVDVDDDYLMDRLTHGTLLDEGDRGFLPNTASRFTDRSVAESVITEALRVHERELRDLALQETDSFMVIEFPTRDAIGEVMQRTEGGFDLRPASHLSLTVRVGPDGPYIYTAYVK